MPGTVTAQEVFEIAMALMDELASNGLADTSDTVEYKNKTLPILNLLQIELYPFSEGYTITEGRRSVPTPITSFTDPISDLDNVLARGVMPYGLAGNLLAAESDTRGNYFLATYQELKRQFANRPVAFQPIEDVYGMFDYSVGG
jgi:hypothetical protein